MRKRYKYIIATTSFVCSAIVFAQQFGDPANIPVGRFDFTPTLDTGLQFDDNVIQDDAGSIKSWSRIIAPQFDFSTTYGASDFIIAYKLVDQTYFSSSEDNYTDHYARIGVDSELSARHRFSANARYTNGHDARGSNFSIGQGSSLDEVDQYDEIQAAASYSYGAFNSDGRLEVELSVLDKDYDINTEDYLVRDRKSSRLGSSFLYRVGPLTDFAIDYERTFVDYDFSLDENNPLDSTEDSILAGVEWEATSKTSGFAKIGYQRKDFNSSQREDFSGFDWSLGVTWEPTQYSQFDVNTNSNTNETNGEGNFIRSELYSIAWRHEWVERFRTSTSLTLSEDSYEGQVIDDLAIRTDDNMRFKVSAFYMYRRWLSFEFSYAYDERDSNRETIDFNRNRFSFKAFVTL